VTKKQYVKMHVISLCVEISAIVLADQLIQNELTKLAMISILATAAVVNHMLGYVAAKNS
jgi:hypothetical protein